LKTGIEELDDATGGINLQDLIVVAGRPGMGKTEFALKIVDGVTAAGGGADIQHGNGRCANRRTLSGGLWQHVSVTPA
jgi:RecA/RadA recombinase